MAENNDKNLYDGLLTDTQAAYEKFFGALVSKRAGLNTNSFNEDSPEYQEFFPHGLTEYSHASLENNIETLMNRMITASAAHADVLGNGLSLEFGKMKDSFLQARGKQLAQKGAGVRHQTIRTNQEVNWKLN